MEKKFEGIIPPIVTPFDEDGTINETLLRSEMKTCMDAGADGLSVAGSTGEGPAIRDEEYGTLIRAAKDYISGEQPIVCGIMRTCTRDAVKAGLDRKSTRLNSSHSGESRMPSSA